MDYQKVEIKWNWSFMWNLIGTDDIKVKEECVKALSVPMFSEDAEEIYSYLLWE